MKAEFTPCCDVMKDFLMHGQVAVFFQQDIKANHCEIYSNPKRHHYGLHVNCCPWCGTEIDARINNG